MHRIYQVRAAAAGMSLQEYLLHELIRNAALRSPSELVSEVEEQLQTGTEGFVHGSLAEILRADRQSH